MDKTAVLSQIDREWQNLVTSLNGLPENMLLEPNVVGIWSIRDILAHISTWEEEAMAAIDLILKGQRLTRYSSYGGIDAFNAREQEKKRNLTLNQIADQLQTTHQRLVNFLSAIPEVQFSTSKRLQNRLKWDTFHHYYEHSRQIFAWRNGRNV